jgi:outer membrane receptor protein involved in Fe transport
VIVVPIGPGFHATFVNGDSANGMGIDVALLARLGTSWELSTTLSWNDLGFDVDSFNPVTGALLFGQGDRLGLSSESTAGMALSYVLPLGSGRLEGRFSAGAHYRSRQATRTATATTTTATGDDVLTGRAEFSFGLPDRWRALLFVDNVTNERRLITPDSTAIAVPAWATYTRPRSVGLQFEYDF